MVGPSLRRIEKQNYKIVKPFQTNPSTKIHFLAFFLGCSLPARPPRPPPSAFCWGAGVAFAFAFALPLGSGRVRRGGRFFSSFGCFGRMGLDGHDQNKQAKDFFRRQEDEEGFG